MSPQPAKRAADQSCATGASLCWLDNRQMSSQLHSSHVQGRKPVRCCLKFFLCCHGKQLRKKAIRIKTNTRQAVREQHVAIKHDNKLTSGKKSNTRARCQTWQTFTVLFFLPRGKTAVQVIKSRQNI